VAKHRFFYLLNLSRHRVHKHIDQVAQRELGVSAAQMGLLFVIADEPGATQRRIAERLAYRESAITNQIKRLEEASLVERVPSAEDKRAMSVRLTARGEDVDRRARPLLAEWNARLMDGFSDEELDAAARFLSQAIERFGPEER